jgi:phage terminase large subunit
MPTLQIPKKLEKILTTTARIVVVVGGRSSGKSEGIARLLMMKAQTERCDILCGREYQNSIDDSVHKLLAGLIGKLGVKGAVTRDNKITFDDGGGFRYKGFARSPEAVKSAQDFKYSWIEEAQTISQRSIDDLLPTIRANNSKLFFTANPQSSEDAFSQRFLMPFWDKLQEDGIYEDDMHLIIMCNWRDNPWHGELEQQRLWDLENQPRAKYDHIWEGHFNDSVQDALIMSEWFDACVDSHIKLGFGPVGAKLAAHDPSDTGPDPKGYAMRHGSIVMDAQEKDSGSVNEGGHWSADLAIQQGVDQYSLGS